MAAQGTRQGPYPWTECPSITGHTHTHSHPPTLGQFRHSSSPHVYIFGYERKPVYLEKTYADMERLSKLHVDNDLSWELIFFLSHQHYNKMMFTEMTL